MANQLAVGTNSGPAYSGKSASSDCRAFYINYALHTCNHTVNSITPPDGPVDLLAL